MFGVHSENNQAVMLHVPSVSEQNLINEDPMIEILVHLTSSTRLTVAIKVEVYEMFLKNHTQSDFMVRNPAVRFLQTCKNFYVLS